MTKKWIAICLAALMLMGMSSALASSPSIDTDATIVGEVEAAEETLNAISAFVANGEGDALDYFGEDTAAEAKKLAGSKAKDLALVEAAVLEAGSYSADQLKEGITLGFPTGFSDKDTIIVIVSIGDETFVVKATASNDMVIVKFSDSQIEKIKSATESIVLAFFKA